MADDPVLPLLVGEGPSKSGDRYWRFPLSGAPARVLCQCARWPPDGEGTHPRDWTWALYSRLDTVNLFRRYADSTPWSKDLAAGNAGGLWGEACRERRPAVLLLGRRVADAFDVGDADYFDWRGGSVVGLPRIVVLPHPSGRNLLLNDPGIRDRVGRTLREATNVRTRTPGL